MKNILFATIFLLVFSCKTNQALSLPELVKEDQVRQVVENQLKGKWVLDYMTPVGGKDVNKLFQIQKPYLNFVDENKVAGNNGCNNIAGSYSVEDNKIHFDTDNFRSTRMFCEGVDETAFPKVLKTINRFTIIDNGQKLMLLTSDIVSMTFVKVEE